MPDHLLTDHDETMRPKSARIESAPAAHAGPAAAAGRTDVLDADAVLGLQRLAGNAGVTSMLEEERSPVHEVVGSGGRPLEPDVRADMEGRLGHDFGHVRVHDDDAAAASAQAVNAHAYTVGSDVVFQRDTYDPSSHQGRITLAHELTHVVQQSQGAVDGSAAAGGIKVSDPSDRFEREASANAERVMSAPAPVQTAALADGALSDGGAAVQRDEVEEPEEELQGSFVQRHAEGEDEELPA